MEEPDTSMRDDRAAGARRLLEIVNGSWMTQVTYVAAFLKIPDLLGARPMASDELARATGAHPPSLYRLMRSLVTIDLCRQLDDGAYELTPTGALLRTDVVDSLRSWTIYSGGSQWLTWGNLLQSVMTGEAARAIGTASNLFEHLEADAQAAATFNQAMVELTRLEAAAIVNAYNFSAFKRLMDVGGGYGELLAAILLANPDLCGVLFDQRHAVENARCRLNDPLVAHRCQFVVGDFFESIPRGADAYVLKSVIHDWNDDRSQAILRNCLTAMHADAKLLLVERIVPLHLEPSARHRSIARADLNMLVGLGGRERTEDEYRRLLEVSGFQLRAIVPAGPTFTILEAVPMR